MKEELINQDALMTFKKNIHDPVMQRIYEQTELKEGYTVIDSMHISYLDGRNSGHDQRIYVSGYRFEDGEVTKYRREMLDATVKEFMEGIKDIPFVFDGNLSIVDENLSIRLETQFCSSDNAAPLFSEVMDIQPKHRLMQSMEYEKMKFLYSESEEQIQEENEDMEFGGMQM